MKEKIDMLDKNNLIVIYDTGESYKSSLGVSIINNYDNSCYINLDSNKYLKVNDNIKVFDEVNSLEFLKNCIKEYDITLIDYIELLKISNEKLLELNDNELLELTKIAKNNRKTLIIISCCSSDKNLVNNKHFFRLKKTSDLMILTE